MQFPCYCPVGIENSIFATGGVEGRGINRRKESGVVLRTEPLEGGRKVSADIAPDQLKSIRVTPIRCERLDVSVSMEQIHHRGVLHRMRADGGFRANKGWLETSVDADPERGEQHLLPETGIDRSHDSL